MKSGLNIDNEIIFFAYKFAYRLCGNRKAAEKLVEFSIEGHYKHCQDNSLLLLKGIWQEFVKYYGFIEFQEGAEVQKILLSLPVQLRCGVILKDIFKYDYEQIAQVLSITPQEVQKIVAQGRRRVVASRKMLTEETIKG
ncbi:MAG: hypothetical protein VR72_06940 [Clostridiaceae bacterium BRH_c20a]|nr:MAG: hypothetical protein VR72_06940 [Clostridiaceae bacterium BRH_c20a]